MSSTTSTAGTTTSTTTTSTAGTTTTTTSTTGTTSTSTAGGSTPDPTAQKIYYFKKQREAHSTFFKKYQTQVNSWYNGTTFVQPTLTDLTALRDDLLSNKRSQQSVKLDLFMLCHGAEFSTNHEAKFDKIEADLTESLKKVNDLITDISARSTTATAASSAKLEPLKIPSFSGQYEDWQSFHDMFQSMVDRRTNLSGAEKLTYLQGALQGSAASVISSYEPTDANYAEAWDHLKSRYSVTREIIFAHIKVWEDFKPRHSDPDCGLRSLADALSKCVRTLRVQGVNVDEWDLILIYMALKKLDPDSRKQWSLDLKTDLPTVKEFTAFVETRARALTSSSSGKSSSSSVSKPSSSHHTTKSKSNEQQQQHSTCVSCSGPHHLHKCSDFLKLPIKERINFVRNKKLCGNCLSSQHSKLNCSSRRSCFKCSGNHHTTLHIDSISVSQNPIQPSQSSSHCASRRPRESVVLLGTLLVNVKDSRGQAQQCRVFVDNGSDSHFISEHCLERLGLKKRKVNVPLNTIGHQSGPVARGLVSFTIESQTQDFSLDLTALVLPKFAGLIPSSNCKSQWSHLKGIQLSDPQFHRSRFTDILLGAPKAGHIMLPETRADPKDPNAPVALNTRFGWMLNGEAPALCSGRKTRAIHHVALSKSNQELNAALTKFWKQEEPFPQIRPRSSSDVDCESHFISNHSLNTDGTYTVKLPFRENAPELGNSRESAVRRFLKVEQRINSQPYIKQEYTKCIREYVSLGYLETVPPADLDKPSSMCYYMPHREVVKDSSSTTKVRIVFDASAKTSNRVSLNDVVHTGPKLQVDLFPLLIRFMTYRVAMSADICKFFPQTSVHPDHRDFQRLVWCESPQDQLEDLRMTRVRVTFGVSSAPFLAIRSLHELASRVQLTHAQVSRS